MNPTSVMGATKRMAEKICLSFHLDGGTAFVSVRFGNVLGSRGSVLPLFLEQIQKGEALTVTHQEMKRYFMTIPEAVSLVLQAGVLGQGGDVMVLDMGDPVRIIDLAEELIRLHGLTPYEDIDIKIIGPRPGEKMFEEYLHSEEGTTATRHEKIFVASAQERYDGPVLREMIESVQSALRHPDPDRESRLRRLLAEYVPTYKEPQRLVPFSSLHVTTIESVEKHPI